MKTANPTRPGALVGLAHAAEYLVLIAGIYALNTLIVPTLFALGCAYLLVCRFWRWSRSGPPTPLTQAIASVVAALVAGAPFMALLALAIYFK